MSQIDSSDYEACTGRCAPCGGLGYIYTYSGTQEPLYGLRSVTRTRRRCARCGGGGLPGAQSPA